MPSDFEQQQRLYDATWLKGLAQGKEQRGNLQANLDFINQAGLILPDKEVLEVGCGIGTVAQELAQRGCVVTGTDISENAIAYGRAKYPELNLQVQAAEQLAFADGTFDVVISFDLLEHLQQVDRHLTEVRRVLRSGGCYLLGTPNKLCSAIFETVENRGFTWRRAHPSLHTWRQLRRRLGRHQFTCEFVKVNTVNEFTLKKLAWLGGGGRLLRRINVSRLPLGLQSNLYVTARRG
jgi:2-polyprenyl-3-methyl-5-hydroxy-6-metoxy-1,4-benzoquinol methylase